MDERMAAGKVLAGKVAALGWSEPPLVLAIAPEAVPIAFEVAQRLHAELDLLEVRPFHARARPGRELGLVASGGMRLVHGGAQQELGLSDEVVAEAAANAAREVQQQEHAWRRRHPRPTLSGQSLVLVADPSVSGRLEGAVLIARAHGARRVVAATPAGLRPVLDPVRGVADALVTSTEVAHRTALPNLGPPPDLATVRDLLERAEEWRAPVPVG